MVWRRIWFLCSLQFLITNSSWTEKLDHGSISGFPSYDEANKLLEQFLIGKSFESRPIYAYILGTRDGRQQHPPQVLLTALTHAREPAGLTVLIYFLGHLLDQFQQGDAQA
ncbi:Carboxypeptidase T [Durusdinium trenchii]|uniref:Carboxypeptidase T n=1 Tax=Durusdinium trenchii TaxID=1381693 RepID=A0ABP0R309_9DINO